MVAKKKKTPADHRTIDMYSNRTWEEEEELRKAQLLEDDFSSDTNHNSATTTAEVVGQFEETFDGSLRDWRLLKEESGYRLVLKQAYYETTLPVSSDELVALRILLNEDFAEDPF